MSRKRAGSMAGRVGSGVAVGGAWGRGAGFLYKKGQRKEQLRASRAGAEDARERESYPE